MTLTEKRFIVIRRNIHSRAKHKDYFDWHTDRKGALASQTAADVYDRKNEEYAQQHPQVKCVRVIVTVDPVPVGRERRKS